MRGGGIDDLRGAALGDLAQAGRRRKRLHARPLPSRLFNAREDREVPHEVDSTLMRLGMENGPSFGQMIRAARLGGHWSAKHGALIRMTTDAARCYIQLWPGGQHVPDGRRGRSQEELHVVYFVFGATQ
jgi:hypothetical protein